MENQTAARRETNAIGGELEWLGIRDGARDGHPAGRGQGKFEGAEECQVHREPGQDIVGGMRHLRNAREREDALRDKENETESDESAQKVLDMELPNRRKVNGHPYPENSDNCDEVNRGRDQKGDDKVIVSSRGGKTLKRSARLEVRPRGGEHSDPDERKGETSPRRAQPEFKVRGHSVSSFRGGE